jgi:NhaP-type Na+/H+ or K+/H+ antiporter
MHEQLPFMLALVAAIVLIEMLATKLRVAYPVLLVVAGLLISFIPGLPAVRIDPNMIFFIFLPPLLFEASWSISFKEMKKWWRIIGSFAFLVVLFSAFAVAVFTKLFYTRFYTGAGLFTRRNSIPTGCGKYRGYYEICKDPQINRRYFRRRKPAE